MNPVIKTILLLAGLLAVVIAGSYYYSRTMKPGNADDTSTPESSTDAPQIYIGAELHPDLDAGIKALQDNRLEEARARLEAVPETDRGYLLARQNLSRVLIRLGDLEGARRELERLADLQLDTPELLTGLAWLQYRLLDYEAAELSALRALEIDAEDAELRYSLGLFRLAQGRLPEAIDTYNRAMEQDPGRPTVSAALEKLIELHEERPDLAQVHYALAFFAKSLSRRELEIEELEHFLATDPQGSTAAVARERLEEARAAVGK
jgi:tetratricopeptide (TPR) repeat protein